MQSGNSADLGSYDGNKTVWVVRKDSSELAAKHDGMGSWEATPDGPVMIVVSDKTTDEKCHEMADRFGFRIDDVLGVRDGFHQFVGKPLPV